MLEQIYKLRVVMVRIGNSINVSPEKLSHGCPAQNVNNNSPVHVVLVSLLVDQLSGLFLIFFGRPKKNCPVSGNFWSVSGNFWSTKFLFGIPKFFLVDQYFFFGPPIFIWSTQKFPETGQFFHWSTKKMRKRPDN